MEMNLQKSSEYNALNVHSEIRSVRTGPDRSKVLSVRSGPVRTVQKNSMTVQSGP